eukprot:451645_1
MADEKKDEELFMPFLHTMKLYCRHIKSSLHTPDNINAFPDIKDSVPTCDINGCDKKETWLCLKCYKIFCGRFGNKHMIKHYEKDTNKNHCIAMGLTDLTFWCYKCNDYLHHLSIHKIFELYKMAHIKKFGIEVPQKTKQRKSRNNPYFDNDDYNFDPEQVKTWRYGDQIRHAMEQESQIQGHPRGVSVFIKLLNEFKEEHMEQVKINDINVLLEIIVSFDRDDLLQLLIEHSFLSQFFTVNNKTDNETKQPKLLQSSLKKAIRSGNLNVLRYLLTQNVINIELYNNENDLKSLLYTILRAIEIGSKKHSLEHKTNCFAAANLFWPYLCGKVFESKQDEDEDDEMKHSKDILPQLDEENENDSSLQVLKAMNNNYLVMNYISAFMMSTIKVSMIKSKMRYDQCIAIFDVLRFLRERYITFNVREDVNYVKNGWISVGHQLIINYVNKTNKNDNIDILMEKKDNCLELEMIDYLISGGMDINETTGVKLLYAIKKINDQHLNETVRRGLNNWNMRHWKLNTMKEIMPKVLPIEINKLIMHMLCF